MYQALYRKYRPKTLDDVCGQDTIVKIIKNSIEKGQINHAYLFAGPRGTGKTSVAKILARTVNCENIKDGKPCGKCEPCLEENTVDIIEIDAASNNGVDEIRELKNRVNLVPSLGKYKVYIIDEVHMLTVGAFNALLKTLEEPPAHVIFVLATTDPQKIPETILSRCQRFDFKRISDEDIIDNLKNIAKKEKIKVEDDALYEIARLSDGGMRDSLGLLDQAKSYSEETIKVQDIHDINGTLTDVDLCKLIESVNQNDLESILKSVNNYDEKGKNFAKLIEEVIIFVRNVLLHKEAPTFFKKIRKSTDVFEKLSSKIATPTLFHYIEVLNKYSMEMKNTNNTKLMFELAFIQIISESKEETKGLSTEDKMVKENEESQTNDVKEKKPVVETETAENKTEDETPVVETEVTVEKKPKRDSKKNNEIIEHIKKIRIDNTLSKFDKKKLKGLEKELEKLSELILNPDHNKAASILMDGSLKAASENNMIFIYKTNHIADSFNENLLQIEPTIEKVLGKKYNLIATDADEWEQIKDEFNHKKRKFEYQEEDFDLKKLFKKDSGEIITMFEDIIEYK